MKTRIFQISDTHLGKKQYGSKERMQDYTKSFEESIDKVIEEHKKEKVDAVVHTGDLFDSPHPQLEIVTDCVDIIKKLNEHNIPFYMIVGNHERKRNKQWADLMNQIEEQVIRLSKEPTIINDVALYGLDAIRSPEWSTTDLSLKEPDKKVNYSLLCMHELINPPVPGHMADYGISEVLEKINKDIDMLALGDYHETVTQTYDDISVFYPGSTEKTKRSESDEHYIFLIEIEDGKGDITKKSLESPRKFLDIELNFREGDGIKRVERVLNSKNLEEDPVLIVNVTGKDTGVSPKQIKQKADSMGAFITKVIDKRNISELEDIDVDDFESKSINERIDTNIKELDLSKDVQKMESLIRDEKVKKSNVRDKVRKKYLQGDNNED